MNSGKPQGPLCVSDLHRRGGSELSNSGRYAYSPGTLHAQISVVPVGKSVVECYRVGNAHLPEVAIFVNLSNTKSSPVYVTAVYVNGVPVNITSIANVYNGSKPEAFNSTKPDLVPIEPGLNHLTDDKGSVG